VFRFVCLGLACLIVTGCSSAPSGPNPQVVMETSLGSVKIELFQDRAPITVKNFLDYVDDKFYDGTIFHRVIADFMIQGGGMTPDLIEKRTRGNIRNESSNGLRNERGTLAMARTDEPDSASSQFFINVKYNDFLDRVNARDSVGYAVFGRVTEGMDVVDRIRAVRTGRADVPVDVVLIKSIRRLGVPQVPQLDGKTEAPKKQDKSQ
jgi:cyclophilin family peptidyl-prolyl cis-trans isomerase